MGVRDDDLKKLRHYAKSLGIKLIFKKQPRGDWSGANWDFGDPMKPKIIVHTWPRQSKTCVILMLLHEFGHHLDWIHNDKTISEEERKALELESERTHRSAPIIDKTLRAAILRSELRGIDYMDVIAKELDIKLPLWKVKADQDLDRWTYTHYFKTGNMPTLKQIKEASKEIRRKYNENIKRKG